MPRKRKPPHLNFRNDEGQWVIHDGEKRVRTGCRADDSQGAEEALAAYISDKFRPAVREHSPARLPVAEVLTAYGRDYAPSRADPERIGYAIAALIPWWEGKTLADVRGGTCRGYIDHRRKTVKDGTIRRELGVLSAAIHYWHGEHGPLDSVPVVAFPPKPEPKPDYLTRAEAALLLAGALGWYRLSWTDVATRQLATVWRRDRDGINWHTARFILLGCYTGTRPGAILDAQWMANLTGGWADLGRGVLHRKSTEQAASKKRQTPTKLGRRILAHLRRWHRLDEQARADLRKRLEARGNYVSATHLHIISWGGGKIGDIGRSFASALEYAQLPANYTPHILRHTRVTWLVEANLPIEEVAAAAGMTVDMVERVYWHRSPQFQKRAAEV